jgi:alpha-L-fucosidase
VEFSEDWPLQDIVGRWRAAAMSHHLPFGLSEHLGASFNWFAVSKGSDSSGPYAGVPYDGNDPANDSLYHANKGYELYTGDKTNWYTDNQAYPLHWFARVKDMIDQYHPDLLYTDGGVAFGEIGLRIVAHLYNSSSAEHGSNQAVYSQKDTDPEVHTVGVYDIERGQIEGISARPWQTDTSVGDWFYNVRDTYKSPRQVLEMLVDIVSKNGNLLLNIPQRPDGTLDDECTYLLRQLAAWMKHNGEGIFDSRPWTMAAEGAQVADAGAFKETAVDWTAADFRFTHKDETLYAYQMRWPQGEQSVIRALASGQTERVVAVRLLGYGELSFEQNAAGLQISLPQELSPRACEVSKVEGPHCFAIRQA